MKKKYRLTAFSTCIAPLLSLLWISFSLPSSSLSGAPLEATSTVEEGADPGGLPPLLPRDREIAIAESAGPPNVAAKATIYVLERGGYKQARRGEGGFTCLVSRDRPDTLEPMCFDPEGTETVLPTILDAARLREEGLSPEEVKSRIAMGYLKGEYQAPRRSGVCYMLSPENKVFNGKKVISFPPHVMFYAPYLTNEDIGSDGKNRWMPWVLGQGTPGAYIIVVVGGQEEGAKP